ncbi:MFS transporter [Thioalkalivibrio sulfidiphilus]|nr:MFS transporter [Thioalkalivibrio sulfidiphilus]
MPEKAARVTGHQVQDADRCCRAVQAGALWSAGEDIMGERVRRREIFGWCFYDFANSAFITVVITVVFGPYFIGVIAAGDPAANTLWGLILAVSQVIVIVAGPVLGVMADVTATKKRYLLGMMWVCAAATAALWFTGPGTVWLAAGLVVVAYAAFSFGENFCASFLSELSTPENVGRISGYGWGFGYLGGLASLGMAVLVLSRVPAGVPWVFVATAVFMVLATLPVVLLLRERKRPEPHAGSWWLLGWESMGRAARGLPRHRELLKFFVSFLLYMSGLGAVVGFAAIYSQQVLGFTTAENLVLFATLQLSSALGALLCGWWQDRAGSVNALSVALALWCLVALGAYFAETKTAFFLVGNLAGLAIGSSQAASRAVVTLLSPRDRAAEFFGFWGVFGKLAAITGPLVMGVLADVFDLRVAVLATLVFFAGGLLVLRQVKVEDRGGRKKVAD